MSKILFIGDPHLKITKFDLSKQFLEWLNKTISEVKPDMVVNLGDTFDNHALIRAEILTEFRKHLDFVFNLKIPYYYVLGNHDQFKPNDSTYHALQVFKDSYDGLTIIDKPLKINNVCFVPYIHDHTKFPTDLAEITVAHQTFVGADYGSFRPEAGVDADKLNTQVIVSGHIHKKQTFGKVIYPGSPFATSANDIDQYKSILLFDTESYSQQYINSPFPTWRSIKFIISTSNDINTLNTLLNSELNDSDHWIIDVEGPKQEISAYFKSSQFLNLSRNKHITIKIRPTDKTKKNKTIKSITVSSIVTDYIDNIYDGQLDKALLKSKALEIISKQ